ncbi:hypothetical protein AAG570_014058 [Ranatra chinensis]|uniref:Enoyl reductase (ER) domain-containing protein n=1 Tax=Ranatra chinensis TaxID=642074 RepID=A0ABD0Y7M8_9HEMI
MKAAVCSKYGPPEVVAVLEKAIPVPGDNEILIKVHATTVASGDCRVRALAAPFPLQYIMRIIFGWKRPKEGILGTELSGEIETVGKCVATFTKGDEVFAMTGMKLGAHAEYVCLPANGIIAPKPKNCTFEESAALAFGGTTALHYLRKAKIDKESRVLIYGASGAVGTAAVQIAKYFGAKVTGVCSRANVDLVRTLGADLVIDYAKEDVTARAEKFDIIFDAVGKTSKKQCQCILAQNGKYVSVLVGIAKERVEDLLFLKQLVEDGKLIAVIDRTYPLDCIVEAHRYVDTGRKKGNVVVIMPL